MSKCLHCILYHWHMGRNYLLVSVFTKPCQLFTHPKPRKTSGIARSEQQSSNDGNFRGLQTRVLKSGQARCFIKPRYRFFTNSNAQTNGGLFALTPRYSSNLRRTLTQLQMTPVEILSDYTTTNPYVDACWNLARFLMPPRCLRLGT